MMCMTSLLSWIIVLEYSGRIFPHFLGAIHNIAAIGMIPLNVIYVSNMFSITLSLDNQQNHK